MMIMMMMRMMMMMIIIIISIIIHCFCCCLWIVYSFFRDSMCVCIGLIYVVIDLVCQCFFGYLPGAIRPRDPSTDPLHNVTAGFPTAPLKSLRKTQ